MSQANRTGLYFAKQTDRDSVVANTSPYNQIRYTASPLAFTPTTVASEEIRADRQVSDLVLTDAAVEGGFDFEYSIEAFKELLSGAFFGDWSEKASASVSDVTSIGSGSIDFDKDVGLFAGALIKITSNDVDLSGVYEVSAWDSSTFTATATGIPAKSTLPTKVDVKVVGQVYDTSDVVVSQSNKSITLGSGASDALDVTLLKGEYVALSGLASGSNGFYRVVSSSDNVYVYDRFASEESFSAPPSGKAYVLLGDVLRNGTVKKYYSLLQVFNSFTAGSNRNSLFKGCVVESLELTMETGSILNGTFAFQGFDNSYNADTYTYNDAPSYAPLNATSNVGKILIGDQELSAPNYIQSASININNNLRRNVGVGTLGAVDISEGQSGVTGSLDTYFGDYTIVNDVINNSEKSLFFSLKDSNANAAVTYDLPRFKYTEGAPNVEGINTDIVISAAYQAILDSDLGYQLSHQEFYYV